MGLAGKLVPISVLTPDDVNAMHCLLKRHFDNIKLSTFEADLKTKQWVILLKDIQTEQLRGFSTQIQFDHVIDAQRYCIIFSGDTIIEKSAWGNLELPLVWGEWMLSLWERNPRIPLVWMLISKGMRTYRFLPTFFHTFYPCVDYETPPHFRALMHSLGRARFSTQYDEVSGVVRANIDSYYLKEPLAIVPSHRLLNRNVNFFQNQNPNYRSGDELLCIARFEPANLKSSYLTKIRARTMMTEKLRVVNES